MDEKKKAICAEVPERIYNDLKNYCDERGQTMAAIIKKLVYEFLEEEKRTSEK